MAPCAHKRQRGTRREVKNVLYRASQTIQSTAGPYKKKKKTQGRIREQNQVRWVRLRSLMPYGARSQKKYGTGTSPGSPHTPRDTSVILKQSGRLPHAASWPTPPLTSYAPPPPISAPSASAAAQPTGGCARECQEAAAVPQRGKPDVRAPNGADTVRRLGGEGGCARSKVSDAGRRIGAPGRSRCPPA